MNLPQGVNKGEKSECLNLKEAENSDQAMFMAMSLTETDISTVSTTAQKELEVLCM